MGASVGDGWAYPVPVPLFRRPNRPEAPVVVTVGIHDHRVVIGTDAPGIAMVPELRGYVAAVTGGAARPRPDGRDPVAVLSAKMDYAELVNDACTVATLAAEELVARGVFAAGELPEPPELPAVPPRATTYDYIQATHARAERRMAWLEEVDALFRQRQVAVLPPLPKEESLSPLR